MLIFGRRELMNKIDKLRKRKALSYNDIAKSANISAQYVYLLA